MTNEEAISLLKLKLNWSSTREQEALKLAIDALKYTAERSPIRGRNAVEDKGQPFAWAIIHRNGSVSFSFSRENAIAARLAGAVAWDTIKPLYTFPPTTDREKRLVEAARVAKEELELFVEFAVRQSEFEGSGQVGRDAVNSLTCALEAYYG